MLYDCKRISYRIDRRLTGLAGPDYDATISFGLPLEPEDSQYGKSRSIIRIQAQWRESCHRLPAVQARPSPQRVAGPIGSLTVDDNRSCGLNIRRHGLRWTDRLQIRQWFHKGYHLHRARRHVSDHRLRPRRMSSSHRSAWLRLLWSPNRPGSGEAGATALEHARNSHERGDARAGCSEGDWPENDPRAIRTTCSR